MSQKDNKIEISFEYGPKVEIIGSKPKSYHVKFINGFNNEVVHSDIIKQGMWTKAHIEYYIPWIIEIDGEVAHKFDVKGKKVKISLGSAGLFFLLNSPNSYKFISNILNTKLVENNCPNHLGIFINTLLFFVLTYISMGDLLLLNYVLFCLYYNIYQNQLKVSYPRSLL